MTVVAVTLKVTVDVPPPGHIEARFKSAAPQLSAAVPLLASNIVKTLA
jgi:hypothetical protein